MKQNIMKIRPRTARPVLSREAYTLRNLLRAFPTGEWVDETEEGPSEMILENSGATGCESRPPPYVSTSVTVIGGTKFDEDRLAAHIAQAAVYADRLITGGARGAERFAKEAAEAHGLPVEIVEQRPDLFGKKANDVHVEQVLGRDIDSKLIIAGDGVRSKQARSWMGRANWPREVVEL